MGECGKEQQKHFWPLHLETKQRQRQHVMCVLTKEMETTQALHLERTDNNNKKFAKEMEINQALGLERKWKWRWKRHKFCINWGNEDNTSFALIEETNIMPNSHLERRWQHMSHHNFITRAWRFVLATPKLGDFC